MNLGPKIIGNFKIPLEERKRGKSPAEKRPGNDPAYLDKVRQLPCCICARPGPSECHHLKSTGERGAGKRSSDRWAVPMCHEHHINGVERIGSRLEIVWFRNRDVDALTLASSLYRARHSVEAMLKVLMAHNGAINKGMG